MGTLYDVRRVGEKKEQYHNDRVTAEDEAIGDLLVAIL